MPQVSASTNPTLADIATTLDPQGNVAPVIEILNETNLILSDMTMMEGNLPTGHISHIRTGLPKAVWRKFYGGVQPSKSTTAKITDTTGMLEAYAECDPDLLAIQSNPAVYRMNEDRAHIEGMNQQVAEHLFYGDEATTPESFTGLAPRYSSLSTDDAISRNIFDAGGTGSDNASIWIVCWSPRTVFGIYPKNAMGGGITVTDLDKILTESRSADNGGYAQMYVTHYQWKLGLVVSDWRKAFRVCNIDRSVLRGANGDNVAHADTPDLNQLLLRALTRLNAYADMGGMRTAIYADSEIFYHLQAQLAKQTAESTLRYEEVGGRMTTMYRGYPLRQVDALNRNEARVV